MENLVLEKETLEEIQTKVKNKDLEKEDSDTLFVIALVKSLNFKTLTPYDLPICGKKMWEYVENVGTGCEIKTITLTDEANVITVVKPFLNEKPYTAIFFSDTPLLKRETFLEIMDYFKYRGLNALKLERGFVFKTEYLKQIEDVMAPIDTTFSGEDFTIVTDYKQLSLATSIIKNRILDFHLANGVLMEDKASTFIDADVIIEGGAVVGANNHIEGISYIDKNVRLDPNNIIKNSIISAGSIITCSYIENSRVSENQKIGPFEKVINKSI